jgi:hypothetical protein
MKALSTHYLARMKIGKQGGFQEVYEFADNSKALDSVVYLHDNAARRGVPTIKVRRIKKVMSDGKVIGYATNLFNPREHRRKDLLDL